MAGNSRFSVAEKDAFIVMSGRTRHAGQQDEHKRTVTLTLDTITAEYFDLVGANGGRGPRMAEVLRDHAHQRLGRWIKLRDRRAKR